MADIFERILFLKKSPVFEYVDTDDLRRVARELEEQKLFSGDRVFECGDYADRMYLVLSGKIGISLQADSKQPDYIVEFGAGDCFGEMGILDDHARSATAHVLEDCLVLALEKERLHGLVGHYPGLAIGMLRSLSLRVRSMNERTGA